MRTERQPSWQLAGYRPLVLSRAHKTANGRTITGEIDGEYHEIHMAASDTVDDPSPVFVRPMPARPDIFEVSYLSSSPFETNQRLSVGFVDKIAAVGADTILKAARGDAQAAYEIGQFLLWKMNDPHGAAPYIKSAVESGVSDALFDLAILVLFRCVPNDSGDPVGLQMNAAA